MQRVLQGSSPLSRGELPRRTFNPDLRIFSLSSFSLSLFDVLDVTTWKLALLQQQTCEFRSQLLEDAKIRRP